MIDSLWPLSKKLFTAILDDQVTDRFVANLIWERLDYKKTVENSEVFCASTNTPVYWKEKFPEAPEVIAKRSASVHLTRSIPKEYKQSLKEYLNFEGYRINELFPRRTRRATAVNWLLSWMLLRGEILSESGPVPLLREKPLDPSKGHFGDPEIE